MKTYLFTFLLFWLLPTVVLGQSINIDQDKNKTVYFDYTSFSELVLAGDGADTGQLAQRISEFFTSTPFSFVSPEIANDYKYNKVQFYTTLKPTQKFLQAYALFISKEIAVYSDSVVKLISPDVIPDYSTAVTTRNEMYHCIEQSAVSVDSLKCLDPIRKYLVTNETVLINFVNSYARLYRVSRFWFMSAQLTQADLVGTSTACADVAKNMLRIERYKHDLEFPPNMSDRKWKATYNYRDVAKSLLPYPKNIAGAEFNFNLGSYQASRLICPIPFIIGNPLEKEIHLFNHL